MHQSLSAIIFTVLTAIIVLFQLGLAAGLPWGAASMGGKFPGVYPPKMRLVAVINGLFLVGLSTIVLSKSGLLFPYLLPFSTYAIWFVVAFSLFGTILNAITPSKIERIWAPVAFVQFVTSLVVAVKT
jgi:hypothetical protein